MGTMTLLLGGARSGKSTFAERLAKKKGQSVLYVATAETLDEEMETRVQIHRQQRPEHWQTREVPLQVARLLTEDPPEVEVVLLDCITLLVSNLLLEYGGSEDNPHQEQVEEAVSRELENLISLIREGDSSWILVSNEVGLGLVPPYPLGRVYRDVLGRANRRLAAAANEVYFLAAGMAVPLHELGQHIDEGD